MTLTICPECSHEGTVLADPLVHPTKQCAACPQCQRVYRVQENLAYFGHAAECLDEDAEWTPEPQPGCTNPRDHGRPSTALPDDKE